jgi:hypothetical protein
MRIAIKVHQSISGWRQFFPIPSREYSRFAFAALLAVTAGHANSQDSPSDVRNQYHSERANCLSGHSNQDKKTCLQEASAAQQERRRGKLEGDNTQYGKNATLRCQALNEVDRNDCERRMRGEGTTSGSVQAGGVYRELVTPVKIQQDEGRETASPNQVDSQR